ncbi:alpha/beta fold hydrolase [Nocardioides zhouii]|uniref:Alpha/beta hydrolase n=1 Tax=Nocardioides zhouii TaxID=1168729 RepID=A0A4Q2SY96_9ACTN|nr:alpha/beta hydrolase [Nocardioides zhouii]RYC10603.1 alpha/beta hydrolase [Nocardioides zhouii]
MNALRIGLIAPLVLAVAALGACASDPPGSAEPQVSATTTGSAEPSLGGTFPVNGRDLYLECWGEGEPTIVLEVGEGRLLSDLDVLRAAFDSQRRVCSYDRANKGRSGSAPTPRTGEDLVSDLHGLLEAAEVPGPYVLVGHSAGGLLVQAYAATFPDEVGGVVALNPVPPWKPWSTSGMRIMTAGERRGEAEYMEGANGESLDYRSISGQIEDQPVPQDTPFSLVISTVDQCFSPEDVCGRTYAAYESIMKRVAGQWAMGEYTEVRASHEIYADATEEVQAAIDDVLSLAQIR